MFRAFRSALILLNCGLSFVVSSQAAAQAAEVQAAAAPAAPVAVPTATDAPAANAAQEHFDITEFRVLGNSLLPNRDIERAVYPFLGPNRDLTVVNKAKEALEKAYKDAGYGTVFADIPEQSVDEGIVRLQVTEGRLDRVRIKGERYVSGRQIREELPILVAGSTPHMPTFQDELGKVNSRSSDLAVTPVLKAGRTPGTVDLDLNVQDTLPLHASIETNNRYSADTTPNRVAVTASYDNLWQLNHSLSFQYQTAPAQRSDAEVEAVTYLARFRDTPAVLAMNFIHTSSDVAALGTVGVIGKGSIYGLRLVDPLENSEAQSHSITLGADFKDFQQSVLQSSGGFDSPIHYLQWSAQYSGAWRAPSTTFSTNAGINFGIRDLVNRADLFEGKRFDAVPNYMYFRGGAQYLQAMPKGFAVLVRVNGQWSPRPLIDNEQLAIGGEDTVRGYLEAEALGDSGATGTLEVRSPKLGARFGSYFSPLYAFVFGDAGLVTVEEPLAQQAYQQHLSSTGVGLRIEGNSLLQGTLDYAIPLVDGPRTQRGQGRVDFSIRIGF
ncbi:MAG TPA: ShlB/FhaC/HecB family hemolysin secretion/activation protein [Steroidobacteraceae bacterium]|jgi:hemolysin activation/secretion protein